MTIRTEIDQGVCQSAGYCVRTAPMLFRLGVEAIAEVVDADGCGSAGPVEVPPEQAAAVMIAARECPAGAVIVS